MQTTDPFPERQTEPETVDYVAQFDAVGRMDLMRRGALNYIGQLASILTSILLVPFMLLRLGPEAYGFWIVALTVPGIAAGLDNAMYLSITRESASHHDGSRITDKSTSAFLSACCGSYFVLGLLTAAVIAATGRVVAQQMQLSPSLRGSITTVFAAVAIGFVAGRLVMFSNAVLAGLQSFGTINAITVVALAIRSIGFVVVLIKDGSLSSIARWYAAVAIFECLLALGIVHRLGAIHLDRSLLQWRLLKRIGSFGVVSFLTTMLQNLFWYSPALLLGILTGGTSATASLYTGQRPCYIVSELNWRGAEVLFSASAEKQEQMDNQANSELMIFGTKCVLAVALPLCIGLIFLAPAVMSVWLRGVRPETATVMRLTAIGVIADAVWVGPLHVLWGRGMAMRVLMITAGSTVSILVMNLLLIPRFGASGAALAFAVSAWLGAIVTLIEAARETKSSWIRSFVSSFSDVALPAAALAALTLTLSILLRAYPLMLLVVATTAGGILYAMLFLLQRRFRFWSGNQSRPWFVGKF